MLILAFLLAGALLGWRLRYRRRWLHAADRATTTAVFLLIFLLGFSVGGNDAAMAALGSLGAQALALSLGALTGSVLLVWLVERWWLPTTETDEK